MPTTTSVRITSAVETLDAVLAVGAADPTYSQLAEICGVSKRTIDNVVAELRRSGMLRTSPIRLGGRFGLVLAVALGTETCLGALVDANGEVCAWDELEPLEGQRHASPSIVRARIHDIGARLLAKASTDDEIVRNGSVLLLGATVAWPAPVRGSGRPAGAIMDPVWLRADQPTLQEALAEDLGIPLERASAINNANADALALAFDHSRAATAEALRVGGDLTDEPSGRICLTIHVGGDIGAATVVEAPNRFTRSGFLDAHLLAGARSLAGELAHFPIERTTIQELNSRGNWVEGLAPIRLDGVCSCGPMAHLESYAGGQAFIARMEDSGIPRNDLEPVISLSEPDEFEMADPRIRTGLEDLGRLLGISLTAPVLMLDPHVLTITGSLGVRSVVRGIEAERDRRWKDVFGDALRIETIDQKRRHFLTVRGAALAVHRSRVHRRFGSLLGSPSELERVTIPIRATAVRTGSPDKRFI